MNVSSALIIDKDYDIWTSVCSWRTLTFPEHILGSRSGCWPEACVRASYTPTYDTSKIRLAGFQHIPVGLQSPSYPLKNTAAGLPGCFTVLPKASILCSSEPRDCAGHSSEPSIHSLLLCYSLSYTVFWTCFPFRAFVLAAHCSSRAVQRAFLISFCLHFCPALPQSY